MVCSEAAADESLAAIRARIRLGIAIAAMIRMIATTISSSISEKPFCCFRIFYFSSLLSSNVLVSGTTQSGLMWHLPGHGESYLGSRSEEHTSELQSRR